MKFPIRYTNRWRLSLTVNSKALNLLGLARRAGRLSFGHDAVTDSIKSKASQLVLLSADASERLKNEMITLCEKFSADVLVTDCSMEDLGLATGMKRIAVLSVNDIGFAKSIKNLTREE